MVQIYLESGNTSFDLRFVVEWDDNLTSVEYSIDEHDQK